MLSGAVELMLTMLDSGHGTVGSSGVMGLTLTGVTAMAVVTELFTLGMLGLVLGAEIGQMLETSS